MPSGTCLSAGLAGSMRRCMFRYRGRWRLSMAAVAPEIVLLPGLDGTGELFERVAPFLAEYLTVKIIRYPLDPTLGYAGYTELVRREIGRRQVFLLGESFSGPVAVRVAETARPANQGHRACRDVCQKSMARLVHSVDGACRPHTTAPKIRNSMLMGSFGDAELTRKVDEIVRTLPRPVRAARLRPWRRSMSEADFAALRCPILVLHGRGDWLVPK